jgi:hypothetical protein
MDTPRPPAAVVDLDALCDLINTWAVWTTPDDDARGTVRRLAAEAIYDLRRAAIAASLPGAERIGRRVLEPRMVRVSDGTVVREVL